MPRIQSSPICSILSHQQYNNKEQNYRMPKTIIITMNQDYPFFMIRPSPQKDNTSFFVRSIVKPNDGNHQHLLAKATFLKNLRNKNLVKVQNLMDEDNFIQIFYENVQSKYDWRDSQIISEVFNQLKNLTTYLSNIGVKASLKSSKIGITQKQILKYYLGIDFEWDNQRDQEYLNNYYQLELNKLFGQEFVLKANSYNNQVMLEHYQTTTNQKMVKQAAQRKISFATLPSRQDRIANIQKEMNLIKSSYEKHSPHRKQSKVSVEDKHMMNSQNFAGNLYYPAPLLRDKLKLAKKWEDRKFSGDIKHNILSMKKLEEKQSDIRSQRGAETTANRLRQRYRRENNQQEIETVNSKSRIEEMKYQQYIHITKSQKNYLHDFMSVLEDDNPMISTAVSLSKLTQARHTASSTKIEDHISLTAEALRVKTQQAILNSRKIINKVRGLPANAILPY